MGTKGKIGNNGIVHVKKFSGATIRDMHSYNIPTIEKKPNFTFYMSVPMTYLRGEERKTNQKCKSPKK